MENLLVSNARVLSNTLLSRARFIVHTAVTATMAALVFVRYRMAACVCVCVFVLYDVTTDLTLKQYKWRKLFNWPFMRYADFKWELRGFLVAKTMLIIPIATRNHIIISVFIFKRKSAFF